MAVSRWTRQISVLVSTLFVGAIAFAQQQAPGGQPVAMDQIEQCATEGDSVVIIKPFQSELGFIPVPSQTTPGQMDFVPVIYQYDRSRMFVRPLARDQFKFMIEMFNGVPYPEPTWVATDETFYAGPVQVQARTGGVRTFQMRCVGARLQHSGQQWMPVAQPPAPAAGAPVPATPQK